MSELKVLSYNILEGLQHSQVQIDVFVEWVTRHNPDIIFYQELNGWSEESFAELAARCGHPYSTKIPRDGYRMGISSKEELTQIERISEGFTLGYIYAKTAGYHLYAVHLNPFEEDIRMTEVEKILAHAKTLPDDAPIIMAGDFNSLAQSDDDVYRDPEFIEDMRKRLPKFTPIYEVTNAVLQAGFIDTYKLHHSEFKASIPSAKRVYANSRGRKIDYIFVSPALKDKCTSAEIVHDEITRFLSDHYPLIMTLEQG